MKPVSYLRFARFVGAGMISLPFNIFSRLLLSQFLDFNIAIVGSQLVGMLVAFTVMRSMVFAPTGRHRAHDLFRFGIVNVVSLTQMWLVSVGLLATLPSVIGSLETREAVSHLGGLGTTALTSFYMHRSFSFQRAASEVEGSEDPKSR